MEKELIKTGVHRVLIVSICTCQFLAIVLVTKILLSFVGNVDIKVNSNVWALLITIFSTIYAVSALPFLHEESLKLFTNNTRLIYNTSKLMQVMILNSGLMLTWYFCFTHKGLDILGHCLITLNIIFGFPALLLNLRRLYKFLHEKNFFCNKESNENKERLRNK